MEAKKRLLLIKILATKQIWLLFFLVFLFSFSSFAQQKLEESQISVPEEIQVAIFMKILTYDRSLREGLKDTIHIGILCFPDNEQSKKNKDAIIENLRVNKDKTINGIPFNFQEIKISTEKSLDEAIGKERIDILYITSHGSNIIKGISRITQTKKILSITGQVDYVLQGISVGLAVKEEKPQIVINLASAKAEGSDFSANLLKLCKVIN